jgi:hypothetical protein
MSYIPGIAAAGFTADQILNFTSSNSFSGCGGLSAAHISNISADAYEGFTDQCIGVIPASSFAAVEAAQVAKWTRDAVNGLNLLVII